MRNTVRKALEAAGERGGMAAARRIRVLDPACGSGSFLIAAFDALDEWLRENDPELREAARRKQHILRENLYGVDKDPQAVAVTRLNLWLRAVERRARLPDIPNIRVGDSLVDAEFDWPREFPNVFAATQTAPGGFDVVIGNPPYVRYQDIPKDQKAYFKSHYSTFAGKADLYVYFYERAHELLRVSGYFGFISSKQFIRTKYGKALREYLLGKAKIQEIIELGELPVFESASPFTAIIITQKSVHSSGEQEFIYAPVKEMPLEDLDEAVNQHYSSVLDRCSLQGEVWTLASETEMAIFQQMRDMGIQLSDYLENSKVVYGHLTGWDSAFIIGENLKVQMQRTEPHSTKLIHPLIRGDNIRRWRIDFQNEYVITIPKGYTQQTFGADMNEESAWQEFSLAHSALAKHLIQHQKGASNRASSSQGDFWWECMRRDVFLNTFEQRKIIYPTIAKESRFTYDTIGYYLNRGTFFIPTEDFFLLGILNSIPVWFYLKRHLPVLGDADKRGRLQLDAVPIPPAGPDDPRRRIIERAVREALDLAPKEAAALPGSHEQQSLRRQLERIDAEIDAAVCALYGLTEEQRARVLG